MITLKDGEAAAVMINKQTGEGKIIRTNLVDSEKDKISINSIIESVNKIVTEQKEELKKIRSLGAGIMGSDDSTEGFMIGWVVKSILNNHEQNSKTKVEIITEEEPISKEEMIEYVAVSLEDMAKTLRENPDKIIQNIPTNPTNSIDTTEVYK